jgi:c-di-GMP-binding flagellar brake protein YcgR
MAEQDWIIENDLDDQERRQYERYSTDFYLCVYEKDKTSPLGQVVDISLGGLQLVSSEPIPTNKHFDLWMDVSMESGRREQVVFTAKSVWGREDDDNDDSYNTGFQFLNLTPEALRSMQSIIDELGA